MREETRVLKAGQNSPDPTYGRPGLNVGRPVDQPALGQGQKILIPGNLGRPALFRPNRSIGRSTGITLKIDFKQCKDMILKILLPRIFSYIKIKI